MRDPIEYAAGLYVRGIVPPLRLRDYRLIAFDMDSTLISIECVDEIAAYAGRKAEVAAITEAAMRGEIADYKESLRRRVALLEGVPESALHAVYAERLRLNPGVERFVAACRRRRHVERVVAKIRHAQVTQQLATVGVRICAHSPRAARRVCTRSSFRAASLSSATASAICCKSTRPARTFSRSPMVR